MLHNFEPTIDAPDSDSPSWYKNYHNSFYLCQLVNNLLLSYMKSFLEMHEKAEIILHQREKLIDKGILTVSESYGETSEYVDSERVYSIGVESFLEELIDNFKKSADKTNAMLMCMGVSAGDYFDKDVSIDLNELLDSVVTDEWYQVVKGFLNVWEFMFLFSLIESSLKNCIVSDSVYTSELINELSDKYPNLLIKLESEHHISADFSRDTWSLFTSLRNVYSHTHGVISARNKKRLTKEVKAFRKSYNNSFHSPEEPSDLILSSLMNESGELFNGNSIKEGKFYLIGDTELNIFRNFSSKIMHQLSREN